VSARHEIVSRHYVRQFDGWLAETAAADCHILMAAISPSRDVLSDVVMRAHAPRIWSNRNTLRVHCVKIWRRVMRTTALRGVGTGSPIAATWGTAFQQTVNCVDYATEPIMVDLGGYVIILVETKDKKIKLYGKSVILHVRNEFFCSHRRLYHRPSQLRHLNDAYSPVLCNTTVLKWLRLSECAGNKKEFCLVSS
jgi:hypothetical protein